MKRHRASCAAGALALLAVVDAARAQSPPAAAPVDLRWKAPAGCPSREFVLSETSRILGSAHESLVTVVAHADVSQSDSGSWRAVVDVEAGPGRSSRTFEAATCGEIASATALILAIATEGRPLPEASPPSPSPAPLPRPLEPSRSVAPWGHQLETSIAAALDVRILPSIAPGGEIGVGWAGRRGAVRLRVQGSGTVFAPERATRSSGEGAVFWLLPVSGRVCASVAAGVFDVGPCFGAELDVMKVASPVGPGAFTSEPQTAAWVALEGSILASAALSRRVAVFVRGDAIGAFARPTFVVDRTMADALPVYRPPAVAPRAVLGVQVRFF